MSLVPTLPPAGTVDVWRIPLDVPETLLRWVTASLDEDERRMRDRMRVGAERWAVARGARREILAGCIGGEATAVRFEVAANGKPRLVGETRVRFNGSARGGLALLAIAFDRELGVDVEQDDMPGDLSAVARQFLLPRERAEIEAAHPEERTRRFAMAWTRHEAARKLRGLGLDAPLPDGETNAAIRDVPVPVGFVASVTAEGTDWTLRVRDVSELLPES